MITTPKHKPKTIAELLNLQLHHPNPVTRSVYRTILGSRLDRIERKVMSEDVLKAVERIE